MKPIGLNDIQALSRARQIFHDCYLVSSLNAFSRSSKGQKILQTHIAHDERGYVVRFSKIKDGAKDFFISQEFMNSISLADSSGKKHPTPQIHNPILKAVELAMRQLIIENPFKKSIINRLAFGYEPFEYNNPSRFMEMFTGIKPRIINEKTPHMTLKQNADKVIDTFSKIANDEDSCFVLGTGFKRPTTFVDWHCYTVKNVDDELGRVVLQEPRTHEQIALPYEVAIQRFKFLVGYLGKDLTP